MIKDTSYLRDLRDLLGNILGAVLYLAGGDDLNLCGRRWSHALGAKGEGNLGDAADGPVSHQVRVRGGVQSTGLQICGGGHRKTSVMKRRDQGKS